jgi:hypothetical protein
LQLAMLLPRPFARHAYVVGGTLVAVDLIILLLALCLEAQRQWRVRSPIQPGLPR